MTALSELQTVLQRQLGLCRRLLVILKLTRQTLGKADPAPLEGCIAQQQALAAELAEVDGVRQALIDDLATRHDLPAGTPLTSLLGRLPGDESAALAQMVREITAAVGEIQRTQTVNARLLQHALAFVDFNMELVAQVERQTLAPATYSPYGQTTAYQGGPGRAAVNLSA